MAWCSAGPGPAGEKEEEIAESEFWQELVNEGMSREHVIQSAAMVASATPELWGRFVTALEALAVQAGDQLVASSPGDLQINQGRAQAYALMYKTCRDAVKNQEEVEARRQNG